MGMRLASKPGEEQKSAFKKQNFPFSPKTKVILFIVLFMVFIALLFYYFFVLPRLRSTLPAGVTPTESVLDEGL